MKKILLTLFVIYLLLPISILGQTASLKWNEEDIDLSKFGRFFTVPEFLGPFEDNNFIMVNPEDVPSTMISVGKAGFKKHENNSVVGNAGFDDSSIFECPSSFYLYSVYEGADKNFFVFTDGYKCLITAASLGSYDINSETSYEADIKLLYVCLSPDKSKILLTGLSESEDQYLFYVLDEGLNVLEEYSYSSNDMGNNVMLESIMINDSGIPFFFASYYDKKDNQLKEHILVKIDELEKAVKFEDNYYINAKLVSNKNEAILYGHFSEDENNKIQGVFNIILDTESLEIKNKSFDSFSEVSPDFKKVPFKKDGTISRYLLRDVKHFQLEDHYVLISTTSRTMDRDDEDKRHEAYPIISIYNNDGLLVKILRADYAPSPSVSGGINYFQRKNEICFLYTIKRKYKLGILDLSGNLRDIDVDLSSKKYRVLSNNVLLQADDNTFVVRNYGGDGIKSYINLGVLSIED